jgi:hypothetical protein
VCTKLLAILFVIQNNFEAVMPISLCGSPHALPVGNPQDKAGRGLKGMAATAEPLQGNKLLKMKRTDAPRFTVGEVVKIHSFRHPRLDWTPGTIEQVKPHPGPSKLTSSLCVSKESQSLSRFGKLN